MIEIVVGSDPRPAARVRFSCGRVYQPKTNTDYRRQIQSAAARAMDGRNPIQGEVSIVVKVFRRFKPTARNYGDVDNFLKAVFDGLNGVAFDDDRQVVSCHVEKATDKNNPRCEIFISKANKNEP